MKFIFKIIVTVLAFLIAYGYFLHGITPVEMYNQLMNDLEPTIETEEALTETQELYSGVEVYLTINYLGEELIYQNSGVYFDYFGQNEYDKVHYVPFGALFLEDMGLQYPSEINAISTFRQFSDTELVKEFIDMPMFLYGTTPLHEVGYNDLFEIEITIEEELEF